MWKIFSEIDIRSILADAERTPRLALIGADGKSSAFQGLLQHGPRSAEQLVTALPCYRLPLPGEDLAALAGYDLRIVLLDDAQELRSDSLAPLLAQPAPLLVVLDPWQPGAGAVDAALGGQTSELLRVARCALGDEKQVKEELLPALLELLPERELAIGRAFPGLRPAVGQKLIASTSRVNAGYAAGTGLAEMIPGLGIPFAVADILILTKNQVVMAYKLGILMGESGTLAEIIPKVAGVVGAGFMWRQVARELVGFLPLGVLLKTAVAYAGTYATGQAVYQYFVTGEKLRKQDMKRLFDDALARGREIAASTVEQIRGKREPALLKASVDRPAKKKHELSLAKRRQFQI